MLGKYDSNEFEVIEYLATSGGLGSVDSDARMTYYGGNPLPHVIFNGGNMLVGAGTDVIDGSVYDPIVQARLGDPSPLKMSISSYSFVNPGAQVTVDLELEGALAHMSQTKLRVGILEDDLTYGGTAYHNILRDMLPDQALTIDQSGQTQQITINFTANAAWNVANLRLVAFVQDDSTKEVIQGCNTRPVPDYSMRHYVGGEGTLIGSGPVAFAESGLFNAGALADTYDITLDTSGLPAGWSANFTYDGADYTSLSVPLAPDARALMKVNIDAATSGDGQVTLTFHSQSGLVADREVTFKVITPDIQVLLVDDDGGVKFDSLYFSPAIASAGKSSATWDRTSGVPSAAVMANFEVVVWECGWSFPSVDADDRAALATYLDGGGSLLITGQDIGWEMYDTGGAAQIWYNNYLHADYIADDTNMLTLAGVPGDPITDGLTLSISGGDGANNQEYPSDIDPRGIGASTILTYDAARNGGIKADTGVYKVVYLSFGFEAINNAADRAALMQGAIDWLGPVESGVGDGPPAVLAMAGNVPNPFNPQTHILFSVGTAADVTVAVFDVKGRRVRSLATGQRDVGDYRLIWDGRDDAGHNLPSGTYFARVQGAGQTESTKMMLVR